MVTDEHGSIFVCAGRKTVLFDVCAMAHSHCVSMGKFCRVLGAIPTGYLVNVHAYILASVLCMRYL